jgi:hypothetical protein
MHDYTDKHNEEYGDMLIKRRRYTVTTIETTDGTVIAVPGAGARIGDGSGPQDFMDDFHPFVLDFQRRTYNKNLAATLPYNEEVKRDLSLCTYVDDIGKKIIITTGNEHEELKHTNKVLDEILIPAGYQQNGSKAAVVPTCKNRMATKKLSKNNKTVVKEAKYLGGLFTFNGSAASEVRVRIKAMDKAWYSMYKFWFGRHPAKVRRMIFLMHVVGAGISGLESYIITDTDLKKLNKYVAKKLRAMWVDEQYKKHGKDYEIPRPISATMLWKWFKIAPLDHELRIRRLRWLQQVYVNQENHTQFIAAIWGSLPGDEPTFDEEGRIASTANSFARIFDEDMQFILNIEAGADWLGHWKGDYRKIFQNGGEQKYITEAFASIDMKELRAWYLYSWTAVDNMSTDKTATDAEFVWECNLDGCAKQFTTKKGLLAHQRKTHGVRTVIAQCVNTNECPYCLSTFADRATATQHTIRAVQSGRCYTDFSLLEYEAEDPGVVCPICHFVAISALERRRHIVEHHLPPPPDLVLQGDEQLQETSRYTRRRPLSSLSTFGGGRRRRRRSSTTGGTEAPHRQGGQDDGWYRVGQGGGQGQGKGKGKVGGEAEEAPAQHAVDHQAVVDVEHDGKGNNECRFRRLPNPNRQRTGQVHEGGGPQVLGHGETVEGRGQEHEGPWAAIHARLRSDATGTGELNRVFSGSDRLAELLRRHGHEHQVVAASEGMQADEGVRQEDGEVVHSYAGESHTGHGQPSTYRAPGHPKGRPGTDGRHGKNHPKDGRGKGRGSHGRGL